MAQTTAKYLSVAVAASFSLNLLITNAADAAYSFTKLVDNSTPLGFNDKGTVAFFTDTGDGHLIISTKNDGVTTTIAGPSDGNPFSVFRADLALNNEGVVAFNAEQGSEGEGIFTGSGGLITTIAHSGNTFAFFSGVALNDLGTVAFTAGLSNGGSGVFAKKGSSTTTIANTSTRFSYIQIDPSINNKGTVAFFAGLKSGGEGIFTGNGSSTTTVADSSLFNYFNSPTINNEGTVAFLAGLNSGGEGIFTGNGSSTTTVAKFGGPFKSFGNPALNDEGNIAFEAMLTAGGEGIFTGSDLVADKVIATGDSLLGSRVEFISFGDNTNSNRGLNNSNQIVFFAELANGSNGTFLATPETVSVPEPEMKPVSLLGLGMVLGYRALLQLNKKRERQ